MGIIEKMQRQLMELERKITELAELKELLDEDVKTNEAIKITGVSRRTLEVERNRPGTLLVFGKKGRAVTYSRVSLIAYKKSKRMRRHGK